VKVVHIVHRFATGGLENGVVNIVNGLSENIDHTIISLTDSDEITNRITNPNVKVHCMHKPPGHGLATLLQVARILVQIRPDVLHTRNIGTLEIQFLAFLLRIPRRIHSEHGRDTSDPNGENWKHNLLRRMLRPLIYRWIPLSKELEQWLIDTVRIPPDKIQRICNGVDTQRIRPLQCSSETSAVRFVTVTRLSEIKDPHNTLDAFYKVIARLGEERTPYPTLTLIGDGPLRASLEQKVDARGHKELVRFLGQQQDIAPFLQQADVFLLGSAREGISNTILEAMAAGLPVIVTDVGGSSELVNDGINGCLVPPEDSDKLAQAMYELTLAPRDQLKTMGTASRTRAVDQFSLAKMLKNYESVYLA
jgi:sugar transferase (PEP-CTERM/EpsH1 system associated)